MTAQWPKHIEITHQKHTEMCNENNLRNCQTYVVLQRYLLRQPSLSSATLWPTSSWTFLKSNLRPDSCLHCLYFLLRAIKSAKLRDPRKFPALAFVQKDSNHSEISVSCIISNFHFRVCILYIIYCVSDCFFIFFVCMRFCSPVSVKWFGPRTANVSNKLLLLRVAR